MQYRLEALLILLTLGASGYAQTFRGAINGSVTDPSGAVVPRVEVIAESTATGIEHTTLTTSDGQFVFQDLPLGMYKVTVTASGFADFTADNVAVMAGTIYTLAIRLILAQASTTVRVSAASLALDTTTETQTMTVAGASLQNAPLNGRDFTQLIALQPGFGGYSAGGFGSVNGTRGNQVNWQIDGVDNNDLWHNIPAMNQGGVSAIAGIALPIDAIEEFSSQTQSSPEAGRNPGGTVNLAIKSGTNDVHGSAYYYNRNEAFAAAPFFLPIGTPKPRMRNEHSGGTLGFPILKRKTFFFGALEKQDFTIGGQGLATEPSMAYQQAALGVMQFYQVPVNPVSAAMLKTLWPSSALHGPAATGNFFSPDPEYGYSYNGIIKVDHKINDKNNVSFRWFSGEGNQVAPIGSNLKYYYEVAPIHVQNHAVVSNSVFSPRFSNQLLLGVNAFNQVFHDFNNSFDTKSFGLYLSPGTSLRGAPLLVIAGFGPTGLTPPKGRIDITGHLTDTLSYVVGKHQYRFGGEYRKAQVDAFNRFGSLGIFLFFGTQGPWFSDFQNGTGFFKNINTANYDTNILSLADFIAGEVTLSADTVGQQTRLVYVNTFSLFFQDGWQLTRKLSVNYGVRYEYFGPLHDPQKDLSTFVPAKGGLVFQGAGIPSLYPAQWTNLAPRLGFAYRPREKGNFVVRAGFGTYYDEPNLNPFLANPGLNGGPVGVESNPAGSNPVSTVEVDSYTIPQNTYIFPAIGPTCPTGNGCGNVVYNIFSVSQNFRTAYNYNYNLNVEQSLGNSILLTFGYVGSEGRKLLTLADINQPALGIYQTPAQRQAARPYFKQFPNFGIINEIEGNGTSNYNSLQTALKIKDWHRLTSQFAYTWAHSLDEMTQYRFLVPQNSFDLKADYGNSDFDTRHNFTTLISYNLPSRSKGPRWLSDGWQVSSLLSFHTGQPFIIMTANDTTGTNENVQRPNLVGDPFAGVSHDFSKSGVQWINPAAFALPAPGTFGNLSRNKFHGPGYGSADLSVFKNTRLTEHVSVQLRLELYNLFKRVNLAPPNTNLLTGNTGFDGPNAANGFGKSTDTMGDFIGAPGIGPGEPFNAQFALKLIF